MLKYKYKLKKIPAWYVLTEILEPTNLKRESAFECGV